MAIYEKRPCGTKTIKPLVKAEATEEKTEVVKKTKQVKQIKPVKTEDKENGINS